jgi:hypothetical protein
MTSYQTHPSEVLIDCAVRKVDLIFVYNYEAHPNNLSIYVQNFAP